MINLSFKNKTILITGGTRGIGFSIAELFLQGAAQVIITGTSESSITNAIVLLKNKNSNYKISGLVVDLSNDSSIDSFLRELENNKVDVLVNNAGVNKIALAHDVDISDFARIQKINVESPFKIIQKVIPGMIERKFGRIVSISSVFGKVSKSKRVSYSTSKFALHGLTKAISLDYAQCNILVNTVSPGFIDTELTHTILSEKDLNELISQVPMKRLGTGKDIAGAVMFLCSDMNTFITGQDIVVDGGFTNV